MTPERHDSVAEPAATHQTPPRRSARSERLRAGLLAMILVLASTMSVVTPARAIGLGRPLVRRGRESPTGTFGANDIVRIDGRITFNKDCPEGGNNDWVYPATDVYIVVGGVSDGMKLEDVTGAMPNTIMPGSTVFTEEVIAATVPGGHLGEGIYDVVYDTCQDGTYDAGVDTQFPGVITVTLPTVLPPASDAIGAMKRELAVEWTTWLATRYAMKKLFEQADKAIKLQCEIGNAIGCAMKKLDYFDPVKKKFLALLLNQANHYRAIAQDPPDPQFDQATRVTRRADRIRPSGFAGLERDRRLTRAVRARDRADRGAPARRRALPGRCRGRGCALGARPCQGGGQPRGRPGRPRAGLGREPRRPARRAHRRPRPGRCRGDVLDVRAPRRVERLHRRRSDEPC